MPKRAAIYTRYSSDRQNERSTDGQVLVGRDYCVRHGLTVTRIYSDDAMSGASVVGNLDYERMLRDAHNGEFDILLAEDLDRFNRNQADKARLYEILNFLEIELHTVADGKCTEIHVGLKGTMDAMFIKNLAFKVRRGQRQVIAEGRIGGGMSYGYRAVTDRPGVYLIDQVEAEVVCRIYADYLADQSPRAIAQALNREGVKAPRGEHWNASTIHGSRKRMTGILRNPLYDGKIVWNRQRFLRVPGGKKRISRPNAKADWYLSDAEQLRIVDAATWSAVAARLAKRAGENRYTSRPKRLLSGLVKCGSCGAGYVVAGSDKRGSYLRCAGLTERGSCDNRRTIGIAAIERRVIDGIKHHLAAPDLVATWIREFNLAMREQARNEDRDRAGLIRKAGDVDREIGRLVDAIAAGTPARAIKDRMAELELQRTSLHDDIAALPAPAVKIHPNAAELYRRKVEDMTAAIAESDPANKAAAQDAIREMIEKVVIRPSGPYGPVEIDLHGRLAALLDGGRTEAPTRSVGVLVAGDRFTRTHVLPSLVVTLRSR